MTSLIVGAGGSGRVIANYFGIRRGDNSSLRGAQGDLHTLPDQHGRAAPRHERGGNT